VYVAVSLKTQLMNVIRQHLALSLLLAAAATNRLFYRELLLFLTAATCISGVTTLSCRLLTGELTLLLVC